MKITAKDFQRLVESYGMFDEGWMDQLDRFEPVTDEDDDGVIHVDMSVKKLIYHVGDNYAAVLLACEFLRSKKQEFQVIWDMAQHENGDILGYAIITSYGAEEFEKEIAKYS